MVFNVDICHFEKPDCKQSWKRLYFDQRTGRCRGRLCSHSCWVQRRPLNPRRLHVLSQWAEVQHQVSQILTQSENPQNETNNLCLPRDKDQDGLSRVHCAKQYTGGFWYKGCFYAHPTGLSSATKKNDTKYVTYYHGGERGNGGDSWSEAEYLLVPN